jgi:hypothetical protein
MHQLTSGQRRLFYQFELNEAVPEDPLLRRSMLLSICPWLAANSRLVIRPVVARRALYGLAGAVI